MTFQGDPYRTLGVAPGASLNEIRSAYRRLAKQYHPDFAGERAVPRFLAIQAAYEQLVDGDGKLRYGSRTGRRPAGGAAEPWRADPARARATRDAWRARRSGAGSGAGPDAAAGTEGGPAAGAGPAAGTGGDGPAAGSRGTGGQEASGDRPSSGRRQRQERGTRKARPGSTTYDEAADTPLDPAWEGGSWYGPSSGTYWTLNPREYADPRRHGPEYQARARRAAEAEGPVGAGEPPGVEPDAVGAAAADPAVAGASAMSEPDAAAYRDPAGATWPPGGATSPPAGATRSPGDGQPAWTTHEASAGVRGRGAGEARRRLAPDATAPDWSRSADRAPADHGPAGAAAAPVDRGDLPDLEALVRRTFPDALLRRLHEPGLRWRLLLALFAWPPLGWALGASVSALTGCDAYAATCPAPVPILVVVAQPFVVAGLTALPSLTAVAAFASFAALAAALPAGAVLAVGGMPRQIVEPAVLGIIVALVYAVAFAAGGWRVWVRPRAAAPAP
jgi:hypothetical protein